MVFSGSVAVTAVTIVFWPLAAKKGECVQAVADVECRIPRHTLWIASFHGFPSSMGPLASLQTSLSHYRMAYDSELMRHILNIFVRVVFSELRRRARDFLGLKRSQCGAVFCRLLSLLCLSSA